MSISKHRAKTVADMKEVGNDQAEFRRRVQIAVNVASPRSRYTVLLVHGMPSSLLHSGPGILLRPATVDASYVDARQWLDSNSDTTH
jgi:hypothetical protein